MKFLVLLIVVLLFMSCEDVYKNKKRFLCEPSKEECLGECVVDSVLEVLSEVEFTKVLISGDNVPSFPFAAFAKRDVKSGELVVLYRVRSNMGNGVTRFFYVIK